VGNLNCPAATSGPVPRVPSGFGLDEGGQAHILEVVSVILKNWQRQSAHEHVNCRSKADFLLTEAVAEVRRQMHGLQPLSDNAHPEFSELVALMANTALSEEFAAVSARHHEHSVWLWPAAEHGSVVVDMTVNMVLAGEDVTD